MTHENRLLPTLALLLATALMPTGLARADDTIRALRLAHGERLEPAGAASHPAWQRAAPFDGFVEKDPDNGAAPSERTEVRVLQDDAALWVRVRAFDRTPGQVRKPFVRYDTVNRTQDFVVVYVDGIGARASAQFFRVNAAGSAADGLHTAADDSEDFAPDFDWDARVAHDAEGWTAVLRLPLASLRYAEPSVAGAEQPWRIMVARRLPRQQFHLFTSVPIPRGASSFIATMQPLAGIVLPDHASFLTLRPSLTLRQASAEGRRERKAEASLDLKWRPRAELVVDATVQPDFSQVELDVPQLAGNSRFALFLTEKRPFFFESADLLRSPTDAIYTRSWTQPRWGLRGTWRDSAWSTTAFAIADEGGGLVLLPGPYGTDVAEQPASTSLAARIKADAGAALELGALVAARRYGQGRGDNTVFGPDLNLALGSGWRVRGQWLHARTSAQPDAQGRLVKGPGQQGDRVRVRLQRDAAMSELAFTYDDTGRGFRHDSGFVNQNGVRRFEAFASRGWLDVGPLNSFWINTEVQDVRAKTGSAGGEELVAQVVRPGIYLTGARNLEAWLEWYGRSAVRTGAGAPLLREQFWHLGGVMSPARWFPLVDGYLELGRFADSAANRVRRGGRLQLNAKLRPLAPLELEPRVDAAWLEADGRRVYDEQALRLLGVWHLDARHSLRAIVQRTRFEREPEPGVGAARNEGRTASVTYAWRYSAGTRVFVGAADSRNRGTPGSAPVRAREAFVKLQLDADEARAWLR